ncbi:hypothetical protein HGRIS_012168 [Hohenbuehelia grisea]|uniref:Uncharacterized protein n=1 Tax=Hohenbuehelia grisea TaxID=104357 RepID=A0ABR3IRJ3_9AGAR
MASTSKSQEDWAIYSRNLRLKVHGEPLWAPEPHIGGLFARSTGVRVGDVGYVTTSGAFETLFSIRAAPGHHPNVSEMPSGFEQVVLGPGEVVHVPDSLPPGGVVVSGSPVKRDLVANGDQYPEPAPPGFKFEYVWSTSEAAILHLPDGASQFNLSPSKHAEFHHQALKHASAWYDYALNTRGRLMQRDGLILVTGVTKARKWMVGSFYGFPCTESAIIRGYSPGPVDLDTMHYNYRWDKAIGGMSPSLRVGPPSASQNKLYIREEEEESSFEQQQERDEKVFPGEAPEGLNQTVLVRGFRITLGDRAWNSLQRPLDTNDYGAEVTMILPELSEPGPGHFMNTYLLEAFPAADAAVTHDDDWSQLLDEADMRLLQEEGLTKHLGKFRAAFTDRYEVRCEGGGVYVVPNAQRDAPAIKSTGFPSGHSGIIDDQLTSSRDCYNFRRQSLKS